MNGAGPAGVPHATLITVGLVLATMMNSLDITICNVALPHMQGSVSASSDQITWVLTSYIVAVAIMTPLTGWLAGQFGRRMVLRTSILCFIGASVLCGISTTLTELVAFRLIQGLSGAALVPITQAILLDINPPERHGQAMAALGTGAVIGPIMGPFLGGILTEHLNWRWVFFINIPIGLAAFVGISFLQKRGFRDRAKFDFLGYAFIALAVGLFQLMLDRGQQQDWFDSWEIRIELMLAIMFAAMFVVQMKLAENRFIDLALFADRNFITGCIYMFLVGSLLMGTLALMPPMLEGLMGYPVLLTGTVMMPRGIGAMISMYLVGKLIQRTDPRALILFGLVMAALALNMMRGFSLQMDMWPIVLSGFVQGFGIGFIFVPLTTLTFATLPARMRNEGAAFYTLIRNLGSAIGISMLSVIATRNANIVHSRLVEGVRPDAKPVQMAMPGVDFTDPGAMDKLNALISKQAGMVSYIDVYWALLIGSVVVMPLVLLMKRPNYGKPSGDNAPVMVE
jgi:DHA2 family multidrug resistance protein